MFGLLVAGRFASEQIKTTLVSPPGSSLKRRALSEAMLEANWQKALAAGLKPQPNDTKPSRFPLAEYTVQNGDLHLKLDPCISYRDHVGATSQEFREAFHSQPEV